MSDRPRLVAAVALGAAVACASYAGQRLWDSVGEPAPGTVLVQATIPYYWRVGFALLHAVGAGVAAHVGLSADTARAWLAHAPLWVPAIVLPAAVAMAMVP
jgi:hypothetical protein